MDTHEVYATLPAEGLGKTAFILDASESATQHQIAILTLMREVLATLPSRVVHAIYFLGNASAYAPRHFASQAGQWFEENRRRASLVTPIWERCDPQEQLVMIIIGSGRIFDLHDWEGTSLMRRVLLVSMGESLQSEPDIAEEIFSPTVQELIQRLHDPVVRVEISGLGFLPTLWDNDGYRLVLTDGVAWLSAERLDNYSVTIRGFVRKDGEITAQVTCASGKQNSAPLHLVDPAQLGETATGVLNSDEVSMFYRAIRQESFACLYCTKQHSWEILHCPESTSILEECVYPSLQADNVKGFVVFQLSEDVVQFEKVQGRVLRLGSGVVAIQEGQRAIIYRYDGSRERWVRENSTLDPYHLVGERAYAILL